MGRPSWTTPDQREYLKTFLPQLSNPKGDTPFNAVYALAYDGFLNKWSPEPVVPTPGVSMSPEALEVLAKEKLKLVSVASNPPHP